MNMFIHDKGLYHHVKLLIAAGRIDAAIVTARDIADEGLRVEALRILCKSLLAANLHQSATSTQDIPEHCNSIAKDDLIASTKDGNASLNNETVAAQPSATMSTVLLAAMAAQATQSTQHHSVLYTMTIILDEIITAVRQVEDTRMGESVFLAAIRMVFHVMRLDETPKTSSVKAPLRHMAIV